MKSLFFSRTALILAVCMLFGIALVIRAYDITDLPLDFHPSRQLFSAIKARGMFYETLPDIPESRREFAIQQAKTKVTIEPEIIEYIGVFFYRLAGKELLWIPRMFSALFWLVGGIFVFLLARDLVSPDGAVVSLAFYLFMPYGIYASRSFQPDPLMVALIAAFWWLIYRWVSRPAWKWMILAGLIGGLAILVKFVAAFFIVGGALGALLASYKPRELVKNPQVWMLGILGVLPGAAWILYGKLVLGIFESGMSGRFIPSLLTNPEYYAGWQVKAAAVAGGIGITLGLLGLLLINGRARSFLMAVWGAYVLFGLSFNYHISTHDYYSLPLLPIVALSLGVLGDKLFEHLNHAGGPWVRGGATLILLYGVLSTAWDARNEMKSMDYRPQEAMWLEIGETLQGGSVEALTQDYGTWLAYWGWQSATIWPSYGDLYQASARGNPKDIEQLFDEVAASKTHFLVTDMDDFEKQPELRARLGEYPVMVQGQGYLIYHLQSPPEAK
jgi:hypothetical protein